jgi:hypothetical protein
MLMKKEAKEEASTAAYNKYIKINRIMSEVGVLQLCHRGKDHFGPGFNKARVEVMSLANPSSLP